MDFGEDVSQLEEGRDYYNDVASGAALPTTCEPFEAFWVAGEETLYRCEETDTWAPYYTPYTYPHPLRDTLNEGPDGGVGPDPDAGPEPDGDSSSGCSCTTPGATPPMGLLLVLLLGALALRRRRRDIIS